MLAHGPVLKRPWPSCRGFLGMVCSAYRELMHKALPPGGQFSDPLPKSFLDTCTDRVTNSVMNASIVIPQSAHLFAGMALQIRPAWQPMSGSALWGPAVYLSVRLKETIVFACLQGRVGP